jgi:hypothetical protein
MSELLKEMSSKFDRLKCLYNLLQSEDNEVKTFYWEQILSK